MKSYLEANARQRVAALISDFKEFLPPDRQWTSPHLPQLNAPVSFDDGVVIGLGKTGGRLVYVAAQEGGFMGGAVGEVHGAKLVGLMRSAIVHRPDALVVLAESGGVRLHEANAGLIAVSEVMRALLAVRAAGIQVIAVVGGSNGCFGGMGIVVRCANVIIMSEEARLAMSGPEVIETANGVEEFDSRDRALVWRTTGGKHRYLLGDCHILVADEMAEFKAAIAQAMQQIEQIPVALSLEELEAEQQMLTARLQDFGGMNEPMEIWSAMGISRPEQVPMLEASAFLQLTAALRSNQRAQAVKKGNNG